MEVITNAIDIRSLLATDPPVISAAFVNKPVSQYERYLAEQAAGRRVCLVATVDGGFAGYVTVNWSPAYPPFLEMKIPEIQDLNVVPELRRMGVDRKSTRLNSSHVR